MGDCGNEQSCTCTLCDRKAFIADNPSTVYSSSSSSSSSSSDYAASDPCSSPKRSSSISGWESKPAIHSIHSRAPKPKVSWSPPPPSPPSPPPTGTGTASYSGGIKVYRTHTNVTVIREGQSVDYRRVTRREVNGNKYSVERVNRRGDSSEDRKAAKADFSKHIVHANRK